MARRTSQAKGSSRESGKTIDLSGVEQIVAAFAELQTPPDRDGFATTRELCKASGKCDETVRRWLNELFDDGRLESRMIRVPSMCGKLVSKPAYRIKA